MKEEKIERLDEILFDIIENINKKDREFLIKRLRRDDAFLEISLLESDDFFINYKERKNKVEMVA